jgi:hypothetical protein
MEHSQNKLIQGAQDYANKYLTQETLGSAEKLQMLSCAYAYLYLKAAAQGSMKELGEAHELIAKCFERLEDSSWASKHREVAAGYFKMKS